MGGDVVANAGRGRRALLGVVAVVLLGVGGLAVNGVVGAMQPGSASYGERHELSISDAGVSEPRRGVRPAVFTVSLSKPSTSRVTVTVRTANGTATSPADFLPVFQRVVFRPGQTTATVSVPVRADRSAEGTESFRVRLSDAVGAVIVRDGGTGFIRDSAA